MEQNRQSFRLKGFDYAQSGAYFITINTKKKEPFFGEIINQKMRLDEIGWLAYHYWKEIPSHFPRVKLDAFIVMPDHVHGIVKLKSRSERGGTGDAGGGTGSRSATRTSTAYAFQKVPAGSLAVIIQQYKSTVTRQVRKAGHFDFAWHRNYWEHVIRDEKALWQIREYIRRNPFNWKE